MNITTQSQGFDMSSNIDRFVRKSRRIDRKRLRETLADDRLPTVTAG